MVATMQYTGSLAIEACCECHIRFAIPVDFRKELLRLKERGTFYCPIGHAQHFIGQSDEDRLRAELAASEGAVLTERRRRERAEASAQHAKNRARSLKGHLTRARKRMAAGMCPCCRRSFKQVRDHLESQHPEWLRDHAEILDD